jgi:hypothetical protein
MKTIRFYTKVLPHVTSIEEENEKTQQLVENIYQRFPNEANTNHCAYAMEKLVNYRHVPKEYVIPPGSYIRMIDMRDPWNAVLYSGGFVVKDNGFSVVFLTGRNREVMTFDRRKYIFFLQMTVEDQIRASCGNL